MFKKIFSLTLILLALMLVSCADLDNPSESITAVHEEINSETQDSVADAEPVKIVPDLPEDKYNGHVFTFLLKGPSHNEWASLDIAADEETGDVINDAIFRRNTYIEEKYDVQIAWNLNGDPTGVFRRSVLSGDTEFDLVMPDLPAAARLAGEGLLYDMKEMPYTDLSAVWWDQQGVKELSIGNRLYYCTGDLGFTAVDTIWIMMFNKTLIRDFGLEDPYEIVKSGDWTFDKLEEMIKGISQDLNQDGRINEHDFVGFVGPVDRQVRAFILSSGESFTEKTPEDYFQFRYPSQKFIEVYDRTMELMHSNPDVLDINRIRDLGSSPHIWGVATDMFAENRILFFSEVMQNIFRLRQSDADFGIIPLPKYSREQEFVPHYVFVDTTTVAAVPSNAPDIARTSIILEALTAESTYTVMPAYYEVSLKTKLARDNESGAMIDLIRASRTYDLATVYDFGGIYGAVTNAINSNTSYLTAIERIESRIESGIERIIEQHIALE